MHRENPWVQNTHTRTDTRVHVHVMKIIKDLIETGEIFFEDQHPLCKALLINPCPCSSRFTDMHRHWAAQLHSI